MNVEHRYREFLPEARRIVVKIGTRVIAAPPDAQDMRPLRSLVKQAAELHRKGYEMLLVSSGAVGAGVEALDMKARPTNVPDLQMCAAVGQARLMAHYEELFGAESIVIGQVLLTHADFQHRLRFTNAKRTMEHMIRRQVIPIINENDVVADEEIKAGLSLGDNDYLAALVVKLTVPTCWSSSVRLTACSTLRASASTVLRTLMRPSPGSSRPRRAASPKAA